MRRSWKDPTTLNNIGDIYRARGDYEKALEYLQQSLKIQQQIGDTKGMAECFHNIGALQFEQENWEAAVPYIAQAYTVFDKIGSPNSKTSEWYLNELVEKLGQTRVQEILQQQNQ